MTLDVESSYRFLGGGNGLALEVSGPTVVDCLARAVEGFGARFAAVHPSAVGEHHDVDADADATPAALLLAVLETSLRLAQHGWLPVGLVDANGSGAPSPFAIEAVPFEAARGIVSVPPVLSLHDLSLDQVDGGWLGRIVAG